MEEETVREGLDREDATEREWLFWFYCEANFGPADGEVRENLKRRFIRETGKGLPEGYDEPPV